MRYEKYREKFRIMNWKSQGINLIDFLNVIKRYVLYDKNFLKQKWR